MTALETNYDRNVEILAKSYDLNLAIRYDVNLELNILTAQPLQRFGQDCSGDGDCEKADANCLLRYNDEDTCARSCG